ncbi:MAG: beta-lactamase family protein [Tannerella sp.]|jgi:CubicO group peptidase (beta-lactamase class C family)|nr:beta-lactamase family protein [Tannerella sp.]
MRKLINILRGRLFLILLAVILSGVSVIYLTGHGYLFRAVQKTYLKGYLTTNIDDHSDFENNVVRAGVPQYWNRHERYNQTPLTDTLRKELEDTQTVGFAVIKDGRLWYEEYWDGYSDQSLTNSFSMAKSITTMLLGKALEEKYIRSIDQPITDFIPEFSNDSLARLCTVGDLSSMTSGFDWTEKYYSPFNPTTEAYFGNHIEKLMLKRHFSHQPGGHFKYSSADTQLLAIVLKRATGKSPATYLSETFWQPMGMEHDALWSLGGGLEKSFCCVHSNVRDFAKLGQLLLQKGNWNGTQLLDTAFVERMTTPNEKAFHAGEAMKYGYSIWMDTAHQPAFYGMLGHLGQRILVVPEKNIVIVRLGKSKDKRPINKGVLDTDIYYLVDEVMAMTAND